MYYVFVIHVSFHACTATVAHQWQFQLHKIIINILCLTTYNLSTNAINLTIKLVQLQVK